MSQHDWLEKDFYKILGVSEDVSDKDLTKAYRKLARKYHPDANPNDTTAEERFKEVSEAYDVLSDAERREEYDQIRKYGATGGFGGNPFGGAGFSFDGGNLSDILGDLFGGRRGGGGPRPGTGPRRGDDLEAELNLSFDDSVKGVTTSIHLTSDAACGTCHGSGAAPGSTPEICSRCQGRGVLDDDQGFFSLSQPCPQCSGRGRVVTNPCPTCRGSGIERKPRQVKVRIPSGVKDGQRIRLKGRGAPGRNGGPAGDLFVVVRVGVAQPVRPLGLQPDDRGPGHVRRGGTRGQGPGPHPERGDGHVEDPARHPERERRSGSRARGWPRPRPPATCSSRSWSTCRPS